ncbi:MAG: ATP synthase F0 subunit C, partial [Myxococcales bacterium]|nr:ATP synthase F0 subunit C [Myxococcales bacterium]
MNSFKKAASVTALTLFVLCTFSALAFANTPAATEAAQTVTAAATLQAPPPPSQVTDKAYIAIAIGFGLGIAAFGGALAQGKASAAALDGIARNPGASGKIFTPMILGLALIESLVIYSLLISFMLLG